MEHLNFPSSSYATHNRKLTASATLTFAHNRAWDKCFARGPELLGRSSTVQRGQRPAVRCAAAVRAHKLHRRRSVHRRRTLQLAHAACSAALAAEVPSGTAAGQCHSNTVAASQCSTACSTGSTYNSKLCGAPSDWIKPSHGPAHLGHKQPARRQWPAGCSAAGTSANLAATAPCRVAAAGAAPAAAACRQQ